MALHFGLLLAFSAVGLVVNVTLVSYSRNPPSLKLKSNGPQIPSAVAVPQPDNKDPPTHPLIVPIASFSLLGAFLSYNTAGIGSLGIFYSACTGLLGIWGLWVVSAFQKHEFTVPTVSVTRIFGGHPRFCLQGRRHFLERQGPTSTRVLSFSATNILRQNRRSDGNESNRREVDSARPSHLRVALTHCCDQTSPM